LRPVRLARLRRVREQGSLVQRGIAELKSGNEKYNVC